MRCNVVYRISEMITLYAIMIYIYIYIYILRHVQVISLAKTHNRLVSGRNGFRLYVPAMYHILHSIYRVIHRKA